MALNAATHLSDSEKATYQTQLDDATEDVRMAQTGMDREDRMTAQRSAIMSAVAMARTAVAGVNDDSTDSEVASADAAIAALKKAIEDAVDLPEGDDDVAAARGTLATLEPQLAAAKSSREDAIAKRDEDQEEMMAEVGEAMHDALAGPTAGGNALANIDTGTTPISLGSAGLVIDAAAGAGDLTTNPDSETLEAVDGSDMSLGDWMSMDYAHSEGRGPTLVTNDARVYTNQGEPDTEPFGDRHTVAESTAGDDREGYYTVDETADLANIMADAFLHSGEQNHPIPENNVALFIRGTFDGAPGQYRCTEACSSTNDGSGSPSALGGVWHFKPDAGAMVSQPDANYLYYGWWVSKDNEGMPTAASAFFGEMGDVDNVGHTATDTSSGADLTGSATYVGNAAGKFAISNPLDGTGNGGHFTADAELTANFGAIAADNENGVTGMIDNFRLNDGSDDPGWSVELNRSSAWAADGAITGPAQVDGNDAATVWSINGNEASASGTWSAMMHDEMPGNAPDGDGSNIPTTVTGSFYSEFSTIGRMVGAFGAEKQ